MNYCSFCGHKVNFGLVPDDERPRHQCSKCLKIHYHNPKMIVGSIPRWQDKILLCKRAIEPRLGKWTLPAGFLEIGESVEDGAVRETQEEANANINIVRLFSVYNLPQFGQVYLMFLADLKDLDFHPGKESLRVELFEQNQIPWDKIAFSAVSFTLKRYFESMEKSSEELVIGTRNTRC